MAKASIDIKALKHDAFRDKMLELANYGYKHRFWVAGVVAVLIAATGLGFGYRAYLDYAAGQEAEAFHAAERVLSDPGLAPEKRAAAAEKALGAFLENHPGGSLAPFAWMYLAQLHWQDKEYPAARAAYEKAREHGRATAFTRQLAAIGLARLLEGEGKLAEAAALIRTLPDQPYGDLKAYSLGRLAAADKKPEEARKQFEKVVVEHPGSSLAGWANDAMAILPGAPQ